MPTSKPFSRFFQAEGAVWAPGLIASVMEHSKTINERRHFKVSGSCVNNILKRFKGDLLNRRKEL
jgi:hypothetical protein